MFLLSFYAPFLTCTTAVHTHIFLLHTIPPTTRDLAKLVDSLCLVNIRTDIAKENTIPLHAAPSLTYSFIEGTPAFARSGHVVESRAWEKTVTLFALHGIGGTLAIVRTL